MAATTVSQSKSRIENLNQRRFGLVSVMAVPHTAGRGQFTVAARPHYNRLANAHRYQGRQPEQVADKEAEGHVGDNRCFIQIRATIVISRSSLQTFPLAVQA